MKTAVALTLARLGAVTSNDGVHMSPADHRRLADMLAHILPSIV